jgi:signal transduction histidine kinase
VKRFLGSPASWRISSQIAILTVVSLLLSQIITAAAIFMLFPPPGSPPGGSLPELAMAAKLLEDAPTPDDRTAILGAIRRGFPELTLWSEAPPEPEHIVDWKPLRGIQAELGDRFGVYIVVPSEQRPGGSVQAVIRLSDGSAIAAALDPRPWIFGPGGGILLSTLIFLGLAISLLTIWAARSLTAPLTRFADAAEHFTVGRADAPLSEEGPAEIRRAAIALNELRTRIRQLVEDRTQMLASIGHDLRTPITRLRLRAEEIEPTPLRFKTIRDLETMQSMVQSALSFLRDQVNSGRRMRADLPSLVQTVCDNFSDAEREVTFVGASHLKIDCDPEQITRALGNLIDNGLKFGTSVRVTLLKDGNDRVAIEVRDDGPGIPDCEKQRALEPFYRGDAARGLNDIDSFGLGLSIAQSIAKSHGGTVELLDAKPQGLLVRLILARQSPQ